MSQLEVVDVDAAQRLINDGALLLDVREDIEFEAGHAPGARHIPLMDVPDVVDELPRDQVIICVCRSGARSARAAAFLLEQGLTAMNLEGGMKAWHEAGAALVADGGEAHVA